MHCREIIWIQNWWLISDEQVTQNQYYIFIDAKHSNLGGMAGMGVPLQMGAVPLDQDGSISISTNGRGNYWHLTIEFLPLSYLANIDFDTETLDKLQLVADLRAVGTGVEGRGDFRLSYGPGLVISWTADTFGTIHFCRCLNQTNRIFF